MSTLRVVVGSKNQVKINSALSAFQSAFPDHVIDVVGVDAPSGVSDQPMGDEETRRGALNRAITAGSTGDYDFACGLEGGCEFQSLPSLDVFTTEIVMKEVMNCMAWMAVVELKTKRVGFAKTGTFTLPDAISSLVKGGMELGHADDLFFNRTHSKTGDGAVGILTHGIITRTQYYEHAMKLALVPFISKDIFYESVPPSS